VNFIRKFKGLQLTFQVVKTGMRPAATRRG
jgi:hypothetical protein